MSGTHILLMTAVVFMEGMIIGLVIGFFLTETILNDKNKTP